MALRATAKGIDDAEDEIGAIAAEALKKRLKGAQAAVPGATATVQAVRGKA